MRREEKYEGFINPVRYDTIICEAERDVIRLIRQYRRLGLSDAVLYEGIKNSFGESYCKFVSM